MENFRESLPTSFKGTWIHVSWPNFVKTGYWEVDEMSCGLVTRKTRLHSIDPSPPLCPHWDDHKQNCLNVFNPQKATQPVHVYQIWSWLVAVWRSDSWKIDFSDPQSDHNIGNKNRPQLELRFFIGHRRCAYYIFRRWGFFLFFLSVAFPARPYIRLPQPVPISKGRRGGCYLKYDPFENSSHVGR